MGKGSTLLWQSALLAGGVLSVLVAEAWALPAHVRAAGVSSTLTAIHMNTRQIFRPSFTIRSRHAAAMRDGRFSSDGQWFVTAGENGGAQLWSVATGQRELDVRGHAGAVTAVAVMSGAAAPPAESKAAKGAKGKVSKRAVTGKRQGIMVSGGADGAVLVWNLATGEEQQRLSGHSGAVTGVALSADGRRVISSGEDGTVKIWQVANGALELSIASGQGAVRSLAVHPKGDQLASGGEDGSLRIWSVAGGNPLHNWQEGSESVLSLAWSGDGQQLASGHKDGSLRIWSVSGGSRVLRDHDGPVQGVAFSPSGDQVASVGQDKIVRLWSLQSEQVRLRMEGHQQEIHAVAFAPEGQHLLTASADQTARLWWLDGRNELARLVSLRSGWAVVSPDGRFDGTLDGDLEDRLDAIQWSGEGHSFALDGFLEKYYRPALLGHLLSPRDSVQAEAASDSGAPNVSEGFFLPPKVTIAEPAVSAKSVALQVEALDQGGGIAETRVYHNDKIIEPGKGRKEEAEGDGGKVEKITYNVELVDGENRFRVVSLSNDRIESEPSSVVVKHGAGVAETPRLHLLVVGVNRYANPALNLNFAVPDAKGMLSFMMRSNVDIFKQVVTYEMYDGKATRSAISTNIGDLYKVPAQDVVMLYFAGHGKAMGDQWFFVPHELQGLDGSAVQEQGISAHHFKEHVARIGAQKVILLFDACESGAAMQAFAEFGSKRSMALLSRSTGIHIATATMGTQSASELTDLGHGVFTYALLEGMKGKADRKPRDGQVSVSELLEFVQQYVPFLSQKYETSAMTPVVNSRGNNFSVAKQ
ncbi:caspase family protein [Candidatus Magnetaquicoccus inordinatus]|uniref:caspase family protein n=1 Tax=Candidatus Magnetaquicoccus inordinatus TaxID=2496818 RepID=UPI00187D2CB9|nr:caspase family protein [Candidatus Magnetaquicoccus inordinatus]